MGKGLATEAVVALLAYGATHLGLAKVIATTASANAPSQRVLLKAGMQRDELRRNDDGSFTQVFVWRPAGAVPAAPR
ncbi:MAG: GNAT family N-acetyltransferase [Betaproteobacteria bacterium]|nr:GNAT family N-acetyltransferase [Betaproteobacteria bacterium]